MKKTKETKKKKTVGEKIREIAKSKKICCGCDDIIPLPISTTHKGKTYQMYGCTNCGLVFIA